MVKMKAPSAMKDSGIEWIGEIPEHWETPKLLYCLRCPICDGPHETPDYVENGIPFISVDSLNDSKCINLDIVKKFITEKDYIKYRLKAKLERNDILFTKAASIGKTAIVTDTTEKFMIWSPIAIIKPNNCLYYEYLYYVVSSSKFKMEAELSGSKNTQSNIGMRELERIRIPHPPIEEQRLIAVQLNQICGTLDNTKSDIEKQIEILNKYKKSVITETVTKGLDKNVELKDSGIDWIGEVPEHWNVIPLKYALSCPMKYGASESGVDYDEKLPRYIRITDITLDGKLKDEGRLSLTESQANGYILNKKCILFARSGATVGKTFMYKPEYGRASFAGYLISAVLDERKMKTEWLRYYSLSNNYWEWANMIFTQATVQNIGADKYVNLPITLPPIEEQEEIVSYLDSKCSEIDSIIETKKQQLELLEEYKKSTIYEYVTGKREVSTLLDGVSAKPDFAVAQNTQSVSIESAGDSHNE